MDDVRTETEKLHRDVFPAEVLMPDGELYRRCRALVTSHRLVIFRWIGGDIDETWYALTRTVPKNKSTLGISERLEVEAESGTIHVNRAQGCRCGPLGHMRLPINW